jgi:hypothetical protein
MNKLTKIADLIFKLRAGNPNDDRIRDRTCDEAFNMLYTQMGCDLRHVELKQPNRNKFDRLN